MMGKFSELDAEQEDLINKLADMKITHDRQVELDYLRALYKELQNWKYDIDFQQMGFRQKWVNQGKKVPEGY